MLKNIFSKLALSILSFGILGAVNVFAQANSCALKLDVSADDDAPVKGASATAVEVKTGRVYRSVLKSGFPYFAELPSGGEYKITVTKAGYKRTRDYYIAMCEFAENGVLSTFIPMVKGSSKQIYAVQTAPPDDGFTIGERNDKAEPVEKNVQAILSENMNPAPVEREPYALPRVHGLESKAGKVLNGLAVSLPKPEYPSAAKAVRASGIVGVEVTIDEEGNVISASAVSGHPLLQTASVKAAQQAKFRPALLEGKPVKVTGIIVYNFVAQ
jgi:TonB family protein